MYHNAKAKQSYTVNDMSADRMEMGHNVYDAIDPVPKEQHYTYAISTRRSISLEKPSVDGESIDAELNYQNALTTKLKVLKSNKTSRLHSVILGILVFLVIILCVSVGCLLIEQQKLGPYKEALSETVSRLMVRTDALKQDTQRLDGRADRLEDGISAMSDAMANISNPAALPLQAAVACTEPFIKSEIGGDEAKCLWVSNITKSWEDAKKHCEDTGAYLVTFNSKCSSQAFGEFLKHPGQPSYYQSKLWIGGHRNSSEGWQWYGIQTGSVPVTKIDPESDWHSGHDYDPGNDCMYYFPEKEGWDAHRECSHALNFACEKL